MFNVFRLSLLALVAVPAWGGIHVQQGDAVSFSSAVISGPLGLSVNYGITASSVSATRTDSPGGIKGAVEGVYAVSPAQSGDVPAGVLGNIGCARTGTTDTSHCIGVLGLSTDTSSGTVIMYGVEGRVNAVGWAPQYVGTLGLGTWTGSRTAGTNSTIVGLEARTEVTRDGVTPISTGTVKQLLITAPVGKGASTSQTWALYGASTYTYYLGGNLGVRTDAPADNVDFGLGVADHIAFGDASGLAGFPGFTFESGAVTLTNVNFMVTPSNHDVILNRVTGGKLRIYENLGSEQLTIMPTTGNVGIGSDNPTVKLQVSTGTIRVDGTGASIELARASAPSSAGDGQVWHDTTQKALIASVDSSTQTLQGVLFTVIGSSAMSDTTNAVDLVPGVGGSLTGTTTLPANFFTPGKTVHVVLMGYYNTTGTPNLTLNLYGGSTALWTSGPTTLGATSNATWKYDGYITCRTTGASGTVFTWGTFQLGTSAHATNLLYGVNTAATTFDTTSAQKLRFTFTFSAASASNNSTMTNGYAEILN